MQALKDYYKKYSETLILKYNPMLEASNYTAALKYPIDSADLANYASKDFTPLLENSRSLNSAELRDLRRKYANERLLFNRMMKVPYTNSVPAALEQMNYLSGSLIGHLSSSIIEKNSIINSFLYALENYTLAATENGYVIDARNTNDILLYMNKIYSVKEGDTALIIRSENEYVAKIQFLMKPEGLRAKALEINASNSIQPFDKVLINLN
jgi:hypothetical protein